jgi:putative transposase
MANLKATESEEAANETAAPPAYNKNTARPRKTKVGSKATVRKSGKDSKLSSNDSIPAAKTGRKFHSARERAEKLAQIAKAIKRGEPLKSAVKQAGISEPTYYQWKKAGTPATGRNELTDLLALENENKRLKSMLAERLRKENEELKRKLGL